MTVVRQAIPDDAAAMHRLAAALSLEGQDMPTAQEKGFFLYVGSEDHYRNTITTSPYCYVALNEQGHVVGFLTTMTPDRVAEFPNIRSRDLFYKNGEYPLVLEQVGVSPHARGKGIGAAMVERMLADSPFRRIAATVLLQPVRNVRSIAFLEKHGWRMWREVRTEKRVWGFFAYETSRQL
jgi:ribosomal protein S18 acetylase RimI-like enzyme